MITDMVRQNWVTTAMKHWVQLREEGAVSPKFKPNSGLLENLITYLFSNERLITSQAEWTDLSAITTDSFYDAANRDLILKSLSDRIRWGSSQRQVAYMSLKAAYEKGFNIQTPLPEHPLSTSDRHTKKRKPSVRKVGTLADVWEDVAFKVLKSELKIPVKHQPNKEAVQEVIQNVFAHLKESFGEVSHESFLENDEIIDATDSYLDELIEQADTAERKLVAEVLKVASNQLPPPK